MKNEEKLFDLVSEYQPQGDQPKAIKELVEGIKAVSYTHLMAVTVSSNAG